MLWCLIMNNITKQQLPTMKIYKTIFMKALGLMFRLRAPTYGVHFPFKKEQQVAIHMFFVFFKLDILWIDEKGVITTIQTLKPFTVATHKAHDVLELPARWCEQNNIREGDLLARKIYNTKE